KLNVVLSQRAGQALTPGRGQIGNAVEELVQATVKFVHHLGTLRSACGMVGRCRSTGNGVKIGENADLQSWVSARHFFAVQPMLAEVISIGDELTSGQRLDTNSQWISQRLG